jgi:hypothetical protein
LKNEGTKNKMKKVKNYPNKMFVTLLFAQPNMIALGHKMLM